MELLKTGELKKLKKVGALISIINLIACEKSVPIHSAALYPLINAHNCRPTVNYQLPQFIVGYGSLMQEQSKREESAQVGDNYPIYVQGYKRGWIEPGTDIGFSTTYLGVKPDKAATINAVYFKLPHAKTIDNYDRREDTYCRVKVLPHQIKTLNAKPLPQGEYWIYLTKAAKNYLPSAKKPIVQSYVDIFLSGCLQLEEKFHLQNFAADCIKTTFYWSGAWVNDRIYPRTAFDNIPYVSKIDPLLAKELPYYFKQIKIE